MHGLAAKLGIPSAATQRQSRVRIAEKRLRKAAKILARLGMKPGDAFNMPLAKIELREGLPFEITTRPPAVLEPEQQAAEWQEALGAH